MIFAGFIWQCMQQEFLSYLQWLHSWQGKSYNSRFSQYIYSPKWHCFPNFHCASFGNKEKFESPGSIMIYTCTCLELYKFYTHYSLTCNLIGCRRILSDLHVLTFKWVKYGKYMTLVYQLFTSFWIPRIFKYLFIIVGNVFLIFIIILLVYTMKLFLFEFFFKGSYSNSQYNTFFSVLKRC